MLRTHAVVYPWDLIDEGVYVALDRLQGEIGVEGLSLWVATPPIVQLRARDVEPRVFRTEGGVFFQPDVEHYTASRCKPVVAEWVRTRNPLKTVAEACDQRKLQLRVRLSAAATGRLALRYPEMGCKNAYGANSHRSICLANPDVQAYLCGIVADLSTNYRPDALTVCDFAIGWAEAFGSDLPGTVALGETERSLLYTCFCESCRQKATAAGVDVDRALRSVRSVLQESLDAGRPSDTSVADFAEENASLRDLLRWRAAELSSLLNRMDEACDCELLLDRGPSLSGPSQFAERMLSIPAAVVTQVERAEMLSSAVCPAARRSELRVPIRSPLSTRGDELVSMLSQAAEQGFTGVEVDDYGSWPKLTFTAVRQAVRFAKRTASH